ncbi:MAG: ribose 5-phosphate isomerase B [Erysipelotrichaceae bacterium]|nr:ribose 5-phosphate isomerase B [Erysipelotrichaceae bacterium]
MKIAVACDHGGFRLKNVLIQELQNQGYEVVDFGTYNEDSCDYPDYAVKAARAVASGDCEKGVVVCGTGIGVSITCNKVHGIRCALCHDVFSAKATRAHNDANMLAMGQRVIGEGLAVEILNAWLNTEFEGGRHVQRIEKMMKIEGEE